MRGSWVYNYYCDESCHLQKDGKRFMVLGYIAAPLHKIEQMKGELKSLRVKYKNTLEVKWTYLNLFVRSSLVRTMECLPLFFIYIN